MRAQGDSAELCQRYITQLEEAGVINPDAALELREQAWHARHIRPLKEEMQTFREGAPTLLQEASDDAEFGKAVSGVFSEAEELLLRKNHDYGSKNISLSPGGPLMGLRVRLHDKFARIDNLMAKGVEPENESLRDSWIDALNYCAIALLVLDGDWPEA